MDFNSEYLIAGVLSLYVLYEMSSIKNSDFSDKTKLLGYFSSVLVGIFIMAIIYLGANIPFLIMLGIICLPFWAYHAYHRFLEDRKGFVVNIGMVAFMIATVWLYGI